MISRWQLEPQQVVEAVVMERNARALHPGMILFRDRSAEDVARQAGLGRWVDEAIAQLEALPHELYEVRRVYRRAGDHQASKDEVERGLAAVKGEWLLGPDAWVKGNDVWRSLRPVAEGSRREMQELLDRYAASGYSGQRGELETLAGGVRRLVLRRPEPPYPATQLYLAVAVAGAVKERDSFQSLWDHVEGLALPRQLQLID